MRNKQEVDVTGSTGHRKPNLKPLKDISVNSNGVENENPESAIDATRLPLTEPAPAVESTCHNEIT